MKHASQFSDPPSGSGANSYLEEIPVPSPSGGAASYNVAFGKPIPPQQQILIYSSGEWEDFIQEWVHCQRKRYAKVLRLTGANDMGIDVAGLTDDNALFGVWDNFQCKHYENALTPVTALAEIAKILWHSFQGQYAPPRKYYFIAPRGCGMSLSRLLPNPVELRSQIMSKWNNNCANAITTTRKILLEGDFKAYVESFDFSIFTYREPLEIIDEHRQTPYHAIRFGGGLPSRPEIPSPPEEVKETEIYYIRQLLNAYADHVKADISDKCILSAWPELVDHFNRQREFFYHAEALRNFARDTVPPGTFEELQNEIHAGIIDIETEAFVDALMRLNAVLKMSTQLQLTANALISVTRLQDRKGICHQLANENRLRWRK